MWGEKKKKELAEGQGPVSGSAKGGSVEFSR